jgi:hypothetical protein
LERITLSASKRDAAVIWTNCWTVCRAAAQGEGDVQNKFLRAIRTEKRELTSARRGGSTLFRGLIGPSSAVVGKGRGLPLCNEASGVHLDKMNERAKILNAQLHAWRIARKS